MLSWQKQRGHPQDSVSRGCTSNGKTVAETRTRALGWGPSGTLPAEMGGAGGVRCMEGACRKDLWQGVRRRGAVGHRPRGRHGGLSEEGAELSGKFRLECQGEDQPQSSALASSKEVPECSKVLDVPPPGLRSGRPVPPRGQPGGTRHCEWCHEGWPVPQPQSFVTTRCPAGPCRWQPPQGEAGSLHLLWGGIFLSPLPAPHLCQEH